jgi:hypothetical protein
MIRLTLRTFALIVLVAIAGSAHAERYRTFDGYEVHYNAFRADFITAEVANTHGLTRSASRGLLNIAVLRRNEDGTTTPVEAVLTVNVANLADQTQAVRMKAVREAGALYYIGEYRISGEDTYRFEVDVQPGDTGRTYSLRFVQQLLADR